MEKRKMKRIDLMTKEKMIIEIAKKLQIKVSPSKSYFCCIDEGGELISYSSLLCRKSTVTKIYKALLYNRGS